MSRTFAARAALIDGVWRLVAMSTRWPEGEGVPYLVRSVAHEGEGHTRELRIELTAPHAPLRTVRLGPCMAAPKFVPLPGDTLRVRGLG